MGVFIGWAMTFLAVIVAWVFFRAPNLNAAFTVLGGMAGIQGGVLPAALAGTLAPARWLTDALGLSYSVSVSGAQFVGTWLWVLAAGTIALALPNTQQIMRDFEPVIEQVAPPSGLISPRWSPSTAWAVAIALVGFLSVISITRVSEFLYWQF